MSLRLGALQDALLDAGAKPELAQTAAEEVASYETRMHAIERDLGIIKWMLGSVIALLFLVLGKVW